MLVVRVLLFYVLLVSVLQAIQQHYDDGQSYAASGIVLGDPIQVDNGFLQRNQDTAHLQNMNDTILSEQGSDAYKNQTSDEESKARKTVAKQTSDNIFASGQKAQTTHLALQTDRGNLLTLSEHGKIDATQEHKIDPKNQLYKHSFAMESSPLNETGGIEITSKNKMAKNTDHTCEEGVQFKVDVINQLTYVPPPLVNYQQQVKYTAQLSSPTLTTGNIVVPESGTITSTLVRFDNHGNNIYRCWGYYWYQINGIASTRYYPNCGFGLGGIPYLSINSASIPVTSGTPLQVTLRHTGQAGFFGFLGAIHGIAADRSWVVNMNVTRKKRSNDPAKEYWSVITKDSEALTEQYSCHQIKRQCLDSGTKHFDELVVTRPCWKEQITYSCESQPIDGCRYFQDQGCILQKSICVDSTVKPCARWQRHYQCTSYEEQHMPGIGETDIFCLSGDCHQPKIDQNKDMQQSIAQLSVLKEIQSNMTNTNPPRVFAGDMAQCTRQLINFTDCCASMGGWGTSLGLSSCSEEEKALAQRKAKNLCHYVGTYCAEKIPLTGICIRKKSTYCCFANKLARLFHEQGRPQLGRGWGSAEHPDCSAFNAYELQKIKFDQMDFSGFI